MLKISSLLAVVFLTNVMPLSAELPSEGSFEEERKTTLSYRYLISFPEGYSEDDAKDWPLLVFLHGIGERGDDLEVVKVHGPPKLLAAGEKLPFVVVSPQCPDEEFWNPHAVAALTEHIAVTHQIDRSRLYLTGLSMGGFGTWVTIGEYPELYAAAAPVCGGGLLTDSWRIKNLPIWVFHGAADPVIPPEQSQAMVDGLIRKKISVEPRITIYEGVGHNSWDKAYADPKLYQWLLQQVRE